MAIKTIGVGGDYSSPSAWEASLPAALNEREVARVIDDLSHLNDTQKTFDINVSTTSVADIVIESWNASENQAYLQDFKASNGNLPVINFDRGGSWGLITRRQGCDHLTIRNLTVAITGNGSNLVLDVRSSVPNDNYTDINNNYLFARDTTIDKGSVSIKQGTKGKIYNNIIVTGETNGILANGAAIDIYNNTFVGSFADTDVIRAGIRYGDALTERNAVFYYGGLSGYKDYLSNAPTFNDNASSDESGSAGLQNLVLTDQYGDPLNHDWSLKPTSVLKGGAANGDDIGAIVSNAGSEPSVNQPMITKGTLQLSFVTNSASLANFTFENKSSIQPGIAAQTSITKSINNHSLSAIQHQVSKTNKNTHNLNAKLSKAIQHSIASMLATTVNAGCNINNSIQISLSKSTSVFFGISDEFSLKRSNQNAFSETIEVNSTRLANAYRSQQLSFTLIQSIKQSLNAALRLVKQYQTSRQQVVVDIKHFKSVRAYQYSLAKYSYIYSALMPTLGRDGVIAIVVSRNVKSINNSISVKSIQKRG